MTIRILSVTLVIFLFVGCGKARPFSQQPADKIIATVNGEPIYAKELKLALALRVKNTPSFKITPKTLNEQINFMIDERLRLQGKDKNKSKIEIYKERLKLK